MQRGTFAGYPPHSRNGGNMTEQSIITSLERIAAALEAITAQPQPGSKPRRAKADRPVSSAGVAELIKAELQNQPRLASDIRSPLLKAGVTATTLEHAKRRLIADGTMEKPENIGGSWYWRVRSCKKFTNPSEVTFGPHGPVTNSGPPRRGRKQEHDEQRSNEHSKSKRFDQ